MSSQHEHNQGDSLEQRLANLDAPEMPISHMIRRWNQTMDYDYNGIAERILITGGDFRYVMMSQRVNDLVEAYYQYANKKKIGCLPGDSGPGLPNVLRRLKHGANLEVPLTKYKENGDVDEDNLETIDLRILARLLEMRKLNKNLGFWRKTEKELEDAFFQFEKITSAIPRMKDNQEVTDEVDYWEECPADTFGNFDVDLYLEETDRHQMGLQYAAEMAKIDAHIEKYGSAEMLTLPLISASTGKERSMFAPVCETRHKQQSWVDIGKVSASKLASGHIHEVGAICEKNGGTVRFFPDALDKLRSGIDYRSWTQTNQRMYKAACGLGQFEQFDSEVIVDNDERARSNGQQPGGKLTKLIIGGKNRHGSIHTAMMDTYDRTMMDTRGFPSLPEERDDMIFTDIVATFITNNPQDWAMCLGKSAGSLIKYDGSKPYMKKANEWADTHGFCVAIRCLSLDDRGNPQKGKVQLPNGSEVEAPLLIKEQIFYNYNELIDYINKRIKLGHIDGIKQEKKVEHYIGIDQKDLAKVSDNDDELEFPEPETTKMMQAAKFFHEFFRAAGVSESDGANAMEAFYRNGEQAMISVAGKSGTTLFKFIEDNCENWLKKVTRDNDLNRAVLAWGELPFTATGNGARTEILNWLKWMAVEKDVNHPDKRVKQNKMKKNKEAQENLRLALYNAYSRNDDV